MCRPRRALSSEHSQAGPPSPHLPTNLGTRCPAQALTTQAHQMTRSSFTGGESEAWLGQGTALGGSTQAGSRAGADPDFTERKEQESARCSKLFAPKESKLFCCGLTPGPCKPLWTSKSGNETQSFWESWGQGNRPIDATGHDTDEDNSHTARQHPGTKAKAKELPEHWPWWGRTLTCSLGQGTTFPQEDTHFLTALSLHGGGLEAQWG